MTEPSAQGDARAEVVALRTLALEFEADARKMRATPRAIANPTNARWSDERDLAARACRFKADVLAQDEALLVRVTRAIQAAREADHRREYDCARAALAAMLQKEAE